MKRTIIESPLRGDYERNIAYARLCMRDSLYRGEAPFAPHLLYAQRGILDDTDAAERILGMDAGFAWGASAELTAVYIDYGITEGMYAGIDRAAAAGREITYRNLPKWTR